jgi:SAM-dependent MidA family methyltransferase
MSPAPPERSRAELPKPSPEARAHGARVAAHIVREIERAGGWISFADYMGEALYAPGLGYYAAGARKFGSEGDFVTAPGLTPLYGRAIATQFAQVLHETGGEILELGPGSGRLAADILVALSERGRLPKRYRLLEVSADLRERQREQLARAVPDYVASIEWLDRMPGRWRGIVFANEVLDSVPPHLVRRRGDAWYECGVTAETDGQLVLSDRPLAAGALRSAAAERFPDEDDYLSELNPAAEALVSTLAQHCECGAMFFIDYGFPASEYYHPQRRGGTVMAHYRHRALADPLAMPGLADLTAHLDFSAIARAGIAGGMQLAGYTSQARFLLNCSLLEELQRCGDPQSVAYLREAGAVQKLTSPAEMGELFKLIAFTRGVDAPLLGFSEGDQAHRL